MTTIEEINQLIKEMKSKAINRQREAVATLAQSVGQSPTNHSKHVQLQSSLQRLDFLMSA